jgi:hypothetical protein
VLAVEDEDRVLDTEGDADDVDDADCEELDEDDTARAEERRNDMLPGADCVAGIDASGRLGREVGDDVTDAQRVTLGDGEVEGDARSDGVVDADADELTDADSEGIALACAETLAGSEMKKDTLGDADEDELAELDRDEDCDSTALESAGEGERLKLLDWDADAAAAVDAEVVIDADDDKDAKDDGVERVDGAARCDAVAASVVRAASDAARDVEKVGVARGEADSKGGAVGRAVDVGDFDALGDGDGSRDAPSRDGFDDGVDVREDNLLRVAAAERDELADAVAVADAVSDAIAVADADGDADALADADGVAGALADAVAVALHSHTSVRTRWLCMSVRRNVSVAVTESAAGPLKDAHCEESSRKSASPEPARTPVTPARSTVRIRLLPKSATIKCPAASKTRPRGSEKAAFVPTPFENAATPLPASVVTAPTGDMTRIALLPESETYTTPCVSSATARGELKAAFVPIASTKPAAPDPAIVDTTRDTDGSMTRMRCPPVSATSRTPPDATSTNSGRLKRATLPGPSANPPAMPSPEPATVVVAPAGVTRRILLLKVSAKYASPVASSTSTPLGSAKAAFVPTPSAKSASAPPASVLTAPVAEMKRMRLLPRSATSEPPESSAATPDGFEKELAVPAPSAKASAPEPASVVTMQ